MVDPRRGARASLKRLSSDRKCSIWRAECRCEANSRTIDGADSTDSEASSYGVDGDRTLLGGEEETISIRQTWPGPEGSNLNLNISRS